MLGSRHIDTVHYNWLFEGNIMLIQHNADVAWCEKEFDASLDLLQQECQTVNQELHMLFSGDREFSG